jgi:chemotaxis protein methyltransferase CheR
MFISNALHHIEDAQTLAQAIVDTLHEPLLVLSSEFSVLAASRAFYETFQVDPKHTIGCKLYDLGDGQWDIAALRVLLETIIPEHVAMNGFEVDHHFPGLGHRIMVLNARKVIYAASSDSTILLAFTDITDRRAIEREKEELLARTQDLLGQKHMLLQEMQHRVANSLQIIASILMLKVRGITSEETRFHLRDAHQRVISVAQVQSQLHASGGVDQIDVGPYLTKLCASLADSMVSEGQPIKIVVTAEDGQIDSGKAVSLGLIISELVINAIKYAFPFPRADAFVHVSYESNATGWRLLVADNGMGHPGEPSLSSSGGLGTVIIKALVSQLRAKLDTVSSDAGLSISVSHADFKAAPRQAALPAREDPAPLVAVGTDGE